MDLKLDEIAINLLEQLIAIPSFSKEEDDTAIVLEGFFKQNNVITERKGNNVFARNKYFRKDLPTILLNSHHDTVRPNSGYTRDPFAAVIEDEKLFGLGSNDAGGPLVSLIAAFLHFYSRQDLKYNIIIAATAEEEISGTGGIESIWPLLPNIDFAVVGEPTLCHLAVAEKGLMVLDCVAKGKAGHAAREEGINAIYEALKDIDWFRNYKFPKVSQTLGEIKMTVTVINAGKQHNVVPAE
jgi:acetylornithine deacetylase/succinyl-diaminopimelate desuccinylase-like protein